MPKSRAQKNINLNKLINWDEDQSLFDAYTYLNLKDPLDLQLNQLLKSLTTQEERLERKIKPLTASFLRTKAINNTLNPRRFVQQRMHNITPEEAEKRITTITQHAQQPQARQYLKVVQRKRLICEGIRDKHKHLLLWKLAKKHELDQPHIALAAVQEMNRYEVSLAAIQEHILDVRDPTQLKRPRIVLEHNLTPAKVDETPPNNDNDTHT